MSYTIEWDYPLSYKEGHLDDYILALTAHNDVTSGNIVHIFGEINGDRYDLFFDLVSRHFVFPPSANEALNYHFYLLGEEFKSELNKLGARKVSHAEKWIEDIIEALKTPAAAAKALSGDINCVEPMEFEKIEYVAVGLREVQFFTKPQADVMPSDNTKTLEEFFMEYNDLFHENADLLMRLEMERLNKALEGTGRQVEIFQTDDFYEVNEEEDEEEGDEFYDGQPMYEAYLTDEDGDSIEDTTTGRYCNLMDVIREIEGFAEEVLSEREKLSSSNSASPSAEKMLFKESDPEESETVKAGRKP